MMFFIFYFLFLFAFDFFAIYIGTIVTQKFGTNQPPSDFIKFPFHKMECMTNWHFSGGQRNSSLLVCGRGENQILLF